jgi:dipeptidase E
MYWLEKSGLKEMLPELLKTRVYAGVSAGSIITGPNLTMSNQKKAKIYKEKFGYETNTGLGFVDFCFRPHLNSPFSPHARKELIKEAAKQIPEIIYALDDQMAIKVIDGKAELVGEGEYLIFNK